MVSSYRSVSSASDGMSATRGVRSSGRGAHVDGERLLDVPEVWLVVGDGVDVAAGGLQRDRERGHAGGIERLLLAEDLRAFAERDQTGEGRIRRQRVGGYRRRAALDAGRSDGHAQPRRRAAVAQHFDAVESEEDQVVAAIAVDIRREKARGGADV